MNEPMYLPREHAPTASWTAHLKVDLFRVPFAQYVGAHGFFPAKFAHGELCLRVCGNEDPALIYWHCARAGDDVLLT